MKKNNVKTILTLVVTTLVLMACVRDTFRYKVPDEVLLNFPVDSIERNHTWALTSTCASFISGNVTGATQIQILSGNPFKETDVEILAEATTTARISRQMNYVVPQAKTQICVAALDKNGNYLRLEDASANQETIYFTATEPSTSTPNPTSLQRIFYCFEADYPNPGDWDYNDIVLSATKEIKADNPQVVALHVSLHAVGYLTQIAAAIRLVGRQNENVIITQDHTTTFVSEPERERHLIKQSDVQLKAINGDAVINLFDDAHLAMYRLSDDGSIYRRYFNTIENPNANNNGARKRLPVTVTYYIDFGDEYQARNFTLMELDPFLVVQYGDNFWEIHTYPYKLTEVLYQYYHGAAASYNNGFSWALTIPYSKFRYPLEENSIGMLKETIVSGAYQEQGHSFGEWVLDHNTAKDWYLYPAKGAVY